MLTLERREMTDKTAIYGARVGKETIERLEGIDRRRLIEEVGRLVSEGRLVFRNNTLDSVEDCESCSFRKEWEEIEEICHERNIKFEDAKKRFKQMLWR